MIQSPQSFPWPALLWCWNDLSEFFSGVGQWVGLYPPVPTSLWIQGHPLEKGCDYSWGNSQRRPAIREISILWFWSRAWMAKQSIHLFGKRKMCGVLESTLCVGWGVEVHGPSWIGIIGHSGRNWKNVMWTWFIDLLWILIIVLKVEIMNSTLLKESQKDKWLAHSQVDDKCPEQNPIWSLFLKFLLFRFCSLSISRKLNHTSFQNQGKCWSSLRLDKHRLWDHCWEPLSGPEVS